MPELLELIKADMARLHGRVVDNDKWLVCVTTGSSDGISKAFDVLLDEEDSLLIENPTYPYGSQVKSTVQELNRFLGALSLLYKLIRQT